MEHKELGDQIERAIGELRPEYRTVILLRHVEGYAYEEIAEVMDLPLVFPKLAPSSVQVGFHRTRAAPRWTSSWRGQCRWTST